jgi:ketosteroid isomerase-like protein
VELARNLFKGWSYRGSVAMLEKLVHPDLVLFDLHIGELRGFEALKVNLASMLAMWPDIDYEVGDVWVNPDGAAISWVMTATVTPDLATKYGQDKVGQRWRSPGISALRMRAGRVVHEADYYDPAGLRRSLGLHKSKRS